MGPVTVSVSISLAIAAPPSVGKRLFHYSGRLGARVNWQGGLPSGNAVCSLRGSVAGATRCSERAQSPDPKTGARKLCPGHPSHDDRGNAMLRTCPIARPEDRGTETLPGHPSHDDRGNAMLRTCPIARPEDRGTETLPRAPKS